VGLPRRQPALVFGWAGSVRPAFPGPGASLRAGPACPPRRRYANDARAAARDEGQPGQHTVGYRQNSDLAQHQRRAK